MTDFKDELKIKSVENWANSDLSVPQFIARTESIVTSNPGTFSNWVKDYIIGCSEIIADLRNTKNDLQTIIDNQADALHRNSAYELILAENDITSAESLQNHFACCSVADDVKEVEALKAENYKLASEVEILKGEKANILSSLHKRFIEKADLLKIIKIIESDNQTLKESVINAESKIPQLPIINLNIEKIHETTGNKVLQEKITILENSLKIIDRLTEKAG